MQSEGREVQAAQRNPSPPWNAAAKQEPELKQPAVPNSAPMTSEEAILGAQPPHPPTRPPYVTEALPDQPRLMMLTAQHAEHAQADSPAPEQSEPHSGSEAEAQHVQPLEGVKVWSSAQ